MGKVIALRRMAEKVAEILPPNLAGTGRKPAGGTVLGVWEAHAEIARLKTELEETTERLREACRIAVQQQNKIEDKQAEVATCRQMVRDIFGHAHELRKRNGDLARELEKSRKRIGELEKSLALFRASRNSLCARNAKLRAEHGDFKVPAVSLADCGFGPL